MIDFRQRHGRQMSEEEKLSEMEVFHRSAAKKVVRIYTKMGGLFIKMGQMMSMQPPDGNDIPAAVYLEELSSLCDHVDVQIAWIDVVRLVEKMLAGRKIGEVFEISEEAKMPVACASLASVYRWKLRETGEFIAVKIQYPTCQYYVDGDVLAQKIAMRVVSVFTSVGKELASFMGDFFDNLRSELDFYHEAENQMESWHLFRDDPVVFVPKIRPDLTSEKVLTMEWVDGIKPTDLRTIKRSYGFSSKQIANAIFKCFATMVFQHGFVHGDLHPGNMFICDGGGASGQGLRLCLLDHGLYTRLDDEFRTDYAKFWQAMVLGDETFMEEYCTKQGIHSWKQYVMMNTMQSYDGALSDEMMASGGSEYGLPEDQYEGIDFKTLSKEEKKRMEEEMFKDFLQIPHQLFFVFRSMFILAFVNSKLGAPVNRYSIMARAAVKNLDLEDSGFTRWTRILKFEFWLAWNAFKSWALVSGINAYFWFSSIGKSKKDGEESSGMMKGFEKKFEM